MLHYTLYPLYYITYTMFLILYTLCCMLQYAVPCTLYTRYDILYTRYCVLYTVYHTIMYPTLLCYTFLKPENRNMTVLQPQAEKRRNSRINHHTSMFQLFVIFCAAVCYAMLPYALQSQLVHVATWYVSGP